MEDREDLRSIIAYLPVVSRSSSLFWPSQVVEALKALSSGPHHSRVDSGEVLFHAIADLRQSLSLTHFSDSLAFAAADGYSLFFDDLMSRAEAAKWFGEVVPVMANLLLRLPSLLEAHYKDADGNGGRMGGVKTGLRILESQEAGIVFLSQEDKFKNKCSILQKSVVSCDTIIGRSLYESYSVQQENKIKCITHYFERICSHMPVGVVSFERKVLPLEHSPPCVSYPKADYWSKSSIPLCCFKVCRSGLIEDHSCEGLEVDFANKYLGGGALNRGCVQEEIRFMINPELIAGMLLLPSMADNEAIEIVGTERFSNYTGYASSFCYLGDNIDKVDLDSMGRRRTRIIAIDALCNPGKKQFRLGCLLREINKAFCGFFDQSRCQQYQRLFEGDDSCRTQIDHNVEGPVAMSGDLLLRHEALSLTSESSEGIFADRLIRSSGGKIIQHVDHQDQIGIVTGNWGCGAFGGDPELKATIQWLAASQDPTLYLDLMQKTKRDEFSDWNDRDAAASLSPNVYPTSGSVIVRPAYVFVTMPAYEVSEALRPFISYYTFGVEALQTLDQVTEWILSHEWTVGELWNVLVDYSAQRLKGETDLGFFSWLLPSLSSTSDAMMLDVPQTP
ncbi:hypothetical protein RHGRI_025324 [Rhododendron griersonianum]|uniref:poly(ADP-ribose) glycohydrolase n=1 Tax=Rhododendron griersonianum TaxID=479676 RepID=A0AAV6IUT9_9ERIC|nr:hypothetical protein RHGRI_025324 [Rhododendron griersonianum]